MVLITDHAWILGQSHAAWLTFAVVLGSADGIWRPSEQISVKGWPSGPKTRQWVRNSIDSTGSDPGWRGALVVKLVRLGGVYMQQGHVRAPWAGSDFWFFREIRGFLRAIGQPQFTALSQTS